MLDHGRSSFVAARPNPELRLAPNGHSRPILKSRSSAVLVPVPKVYMSLVLLLLTPHAGPLDLQHQDTSAPPAQRTNALRPRLFVYSATVLHSVSESGPAVQTTVVQQGHRLTTGNANSPLPKTSSPLYKSPPRPRSCLPPSENAPANPHRQTHTTARRGPPDPRGPSASSSRNAWAPGTLEARPPGTGCADSAAVPHRTQRGRRASTRLSTPAFLPESLSQSSRVCPASLWTLEKRARLETDGHGE